MSDHARSKQQTPARFAFLRVPLFRLLAINLAAGMAVAALLVGGLLALNPFGLRHLIFADNSPRNNNLGAYEMQFRSVAGGDCQAVYPAVRPPAPPQFPAAYPNSWLRVQRRGDRFSAFGSTNGKAWKLYAVQTLALARMVYVGPALTSHDPQKTARACYRNYTAPR